VGQQSFVYGWVRGLVNLGCIAALTVCLSVCLSVFLFSILVHGRQASFAALKADSGQLRGAVSRLEAELSAERAARRRAEDAQARAAEPARALAVSCQPVASAGLQWHVLAMKKDRGSHEEGWRSRAV
jgi:hypothetical protein